MGYLVREIKQMLSTPKSLFLTPDFSRHWHCTAVQSLRMRSKHTAARVLHTCRTPAHPQSLP